MKSAFLKIKVWQNWANYDQILGQSLATKLNLSKFKNLNSLKVHEYQVLSKKVKNCDLYTFYNPLKLKVNSVHWSLIVDNRLSPTLLSRAIVGKMK